MSLSDRLRAARQQRDSRGTDEVVDLTTDSPEHEAEHKLSPRFGFPTKCPECGGRGYLDRVDLVDRIQYQHCIACGHTWSLTEADMLV